MAVFNYTALNAEGHKTAGVVQSDSARQARSQLREDGLTPLDVTPIATAANAPRAEFRRLRAKDFQLFYRVLGSLLGAGIELADALESSARQAVPRTRALYLAVHAEVVQGKNLSDALAALNLTLPAMSLAALAAGERSGRIAPVLTGLADHAERHAQMRAQVGLALIYPAVLVVVALSVALGLVTYVVPEIVRVFVGFQQELPWLTRALIRCSEFLSAWGLWLLLAVFAVAPILLRAARSTVGQYWLDRIVLSVPMVSALYRAIERERFLDTLAMLLTGAVPLVDALNAAGAVVSSPSIRELIARVAHDVERGRALDVSIAETGMLSPVALQLVAAGVEGGKLESMLESAATMERQDIQNKIAIALGLLEPILILLMGGFVLLIVVAILLPVFELNRLIA